MIVIRTKHDIATVYLYYYTDSLIKEAEEKGFKVIKIEGEEITEENIRKRIKNQKPNFIFFNGHGSSTSLRDNKCDEFINLNSADLFKKTVTYARSCNCLNKLGKEAVRKGCSAFIGYNKPFWIARSHKRECQPLKDNVAKPILESSNTVVKQLLKGHSVDKAVKKSHEKAADYILKLIYSKEPLASASLQALVSNDEALDYEGEASAKIC